MTQQRTQKPLPFFFISKQEVTTRVENYMSNKHGALSTAIGKEETKAIWYSINHIDQLVKELSYLDADGLRIYIGSYSHTHPDFSDQLCLIMVPTRLNAETNQHEDVILEEEFDFNIRPGSDQQSDEIQDDSKNFNYGSPCPPVCSLQILKYPL